MLRKGSSDFPTLGVPDCEPGVPIFPERHYVSCKASFRSSVVINVEILSLKNPFHAALRERVYNLQWICAEMWGSGPEFIYVSIVS